MRTTSPLWTRMCPGMMRPSDAVIWYLRTTAGTAAAAGAVACTAGAGAAVLAAAFAGALRRLLASSCCDATTGAAQRVAIATIPQTVFMIVLDMVPPLHIEYEEEGGAVKEDPAASADRRAAASAMRENWTNGPRPAGAQRLRVNSTMTVACTATGVPPSRAGR